MADDLAVDTAASGNLASVVAHRHGNVDLLQEVDPAARQEPVRGLAVDREVEDPGRFGELELPANVRRREVRQPPDVCERDDGVRPVA